MLDSEDRSRRKHDKIEISLIDDSGSTALTISDLKELKWIAKTSRFTKWLIAIAFGLSTMTWVPHLLDSISSLFKHK
jgi:hypothetical protein